MLQRPLSLQCGAYHLVAALLICFGAATYARQLNVQSSHTARQLQAELSLTTKDSQAKELAISMNASSDYGDQWSSRKIVDAVIEQASQEASRRGVVIRSLSATHHAASPSSWGKVTLEVLTIGSYTASKAWQSALIQAYPSMAVQNLRMQTAPGSSSGLESRWMWMLHVRD